MQNFELESINELQSERIDTPLGVMLALASQDGLCLLEFEDRPGLDDEIRSVTKQLTGIRTASNGQHLQQVKQELQAYFAGSALTFATPLVLTGSPFELSVWTLLQAIPPGETRSYAQLALQFGRPAAARAVGTANGKNPLAVVIPCHRLVRSDGGLGGYGGGLWRKKWLLEHERKYTR